VPFETETSVAPLKVHMAEQVEPVRTTEHETPAIDPLHAQVVAVAPSPASVAPEQHCALELFELEEHPPLSSATTARPTSPARHK
jgi:hypothetical protein